MGGVSTLWLACVPFLNNASKIVERGGKKGGGVGGGGVTESKLYADILDSDSNACDS